MQIRSRFQLYEAEGVDSGGCQRVQDTDVSFKKEARGSYVSQSEDLGDITKTISIKEILLTIADITGCPPRELINKRRSREVIPYRHLLYALSKELTWQSFPQIAKAMNRDHTTVYHGAKVGEKLIKTDPNIKEVYNKVKMRLVA
tara:strand:- start:52 stop:486 length:435 start_codon:yes stop_codon:yes gene_type:complete